jgi:hypothetical protein
LHHGIAGAVERQEPVAVIEAAQARVRLSLVRRFAGHEFHDQIPGLVGAPGLAAHTIEQIENEAFHRDAPSSW